MLLVWMIVITGRLVALQVVRYGEFTQRASRQQQRTVEVSSRRGVIYDRNGHELAMTINVDSVFAVPSEIPDPGNTASLLARILKAEPREVLARLEGSRSFVWIARKVEPEIADRIRKLSLKGIYFEKESKRFYPKRELASQVLGYVGLDDEGLGGVERAFEERLKGRPGKMLISVDARQRSLGRVEKQPEPGNNVVLTLDEKIQYIAERELQRSIEETKAEAGTVVVQNPKTGEILALASWPTFNPNAFRNSSQAQMKNRAVSDIYEPGSTFKIITIAAALEEKLTTPEEVIDCQMGSITIFGHRIRDHKPFGNLTVSQVMQQSSDVGAIKLGLRLGESRFDQYIRAFGFGAQTGMELPGETRGMTKPAARWNKTSIGAISMGQEIGVSSVQLVSMVSAIANDGIYTPPRIVAGTLPPRTTPQTVTFQPATQRRILSPLTAVQMKKMLEDTVLFGTGKKAILNGYTSAGKTGTAQKIDPATGTYSKWKHIASFGGFAPVNSPAITITVMLDSP
ncbi:MAG TPA: penicillin-binding protein 2, partial [Terriglobales bacterium]|nr:penicillin-binding protein 2 [Terriglobales bacterium]